MRLLLGCVLFAGCVLDEPVDVSTSEQELAAWGSFVLNCGSAPTCESDIGTAIDRTCFLGGISGPIATETDHWTAGTGVFRNPANYNRYLLRIGNTSARHATVIAICVSGAVDRVEAHWHTLVGGPTIIPSGSPNRRCFLSNIASDEGFYVPPQYPDSTPNYIAIYKHPGHGTWHLNGDLDRAQANPTGRAAAVCLDVPELVASTFVTVPDWQSGTQTGFLVDDSTAACGLTHVGGQFQYHVRLEDRTDRHFEGMQALFTNHHDWRWSITNAKGQTKTAGFSCVR
jgi:hypothetical protein